MPHCWLLRRTTDFGHVLLSSPGWDSSCSCSQAAVKGKKCQVNIVNCTNSHLCVVCSHTRMGKICPKLIQIALFLSCFHVLCPSLPQGNQVNGPECWGSGVWTGSCSLVSRLALLNLRFAKWGRCRNSSVLASLDTLDTESWNPNKEDINQRMPKWLFPFWWRLRSWTGFCLLLSSIYFFVSVHTSQQKDNIPQQWQEDTLPGIFICSALNNHHTL